MALTAEQRALRREIPTSFFNQLMKGERAHDIIQNQWLKCVGDPRYVEEKHDDSWQSRFGWAIEPLALDWHEQKTRNEISRRGEVVVHPHRHYVSTTLDGYMVAESKVIDVKAYSAFYSTDDIIRDCTPQLIGARGCTGALYASLLIVHGGAEPAEHPIDDMPEYEKILWERVDAFWWCVENLVSPLERTDIITPVVPPEKWRRINLDTDTELPNWAESMRNAFTQWSDTKDSADRHEFARNLVKTILPEDVARCIGNGIIASRAKNMAVTIRRAK
jgi:YqaJ-like viral recombinase domain